MTHVFFMLLACVAAIAVARRLWLWAPDWWALHRADPHARAYLIAQLPADAEASERRMTEALTELTVQHSARRPFELIYHWRGAETGTEAEVIIGDGRDKIEHTRQLLSAKYDGDATFATVTDRTPWAKLLGED